MDAGGGPPDPGRHLQLGRPRGVLPGRAPRAGGSGSGSASTPATSPWSRSTPASTGSRPPTGSPTGWPAPRTTFLFNIKAYRSLTGHEREEGRPRPPTAEEERAFLEALVPAPGVREAGRGALPVPPLAGQRARGTRGGAAGPRPAPRRRPSPSSSVTAPGSRRSGSPRPRTCSGSWTAPWWGWTPPSWAAGPRRRTWRSPPPVWCWSASTGATTRPGTAGWPPPASASTTSTRPSSWRSGFRRSSAAAERGVPVHVLMNNNRSNYAVVNGFDMAHLLGVRLPPPPEPILRRMERARRRGARLGAGCI